MISSDTSIEPLGRTERLTLWGILVVGGLVPLILFGLCVEQDAISADRPSVDASILHTPESQQLAAVVSGFVMKPIYTLLSLVFAVLLWRRRAIDLVALRWGMVAFFLGENCCAANYLLYNETSYLLEYLHMFGMTVSFGFTIYAVLEGVDRRILMLSDPNCKCAAMSLCGRCIKYAEVPCGLKRTFQLITPVCIILAFMPLHADGISTSQDTVIYGTPYAFSHLTYQGAFEKYYCPIGAIVLLTASWLVLILKRDNPLPLAKLTFSAAMGALGFGVFRLILVSFYRENLVWSAFWEETTELLFIVAVGCILWTFREGLFQKKP